MRTHVMRVAAGLAALAGFAVCTEAAVAPSSGNDFPEICTRILCPPGQICGITKDGTGGCIPAPTVPPECARILCLNTAGCGVLPDGRVGCLPTPTKPPTNTLPPECAAISCLVGFSCGFLPDGRVGCIPPVTKPPTVTLPPECAAILCEVGNTCGFLPDGTVGCIPAPTKPPATTLPPPCSFSRPSTCFCPAVFDPVPCCNNGELCTASNSCVCGCGGGVGPGDDGTCRATDPISTCKNVKCDALTECVETAEGPKCAPKTCPCPKNLAWTCCRRADGTEYDAANPCICECTGSVISSGRCEADCDDEH